MVFLKEIQGDLESSLEKPAQFFEKIKREYTSEQLVKIYDYILENCSDIVFLGITLKEIDKHRNRGNLDCLLDFLMTKNDKKGAIANSQVSDFLNIRVLCIKVVSNFRDKKSVPALLYCLNSKNEHYKFRLAAAEALGKIGDRNAVESLIEVVRDENEKSVYVRESAAKALGMIGDLRAVEAFLEILEGKKSFLDKFTFLKEHVIEAIGKMELSLHNFAENKRVLNALKNALGDDSPQIRLNAIDSLANSNFPEAEDLIKQMIFDTDPDVACGAITALHWLFGDSEIEKLLKGKNLPKFASSYAKELLEEESERRTRGGKDE